MSLRSRCSTHCLRTLRIARTLIRCGVGKNAAKLGLGYRVMRLIARSLVRIFYSTVEVTGLEHLDATRPTLYAPTHPNSIIDPLLVALVENRVIRFVARDGLFRVPLLGWLLRMGGAIPVARRSDHNGKVDNSKAFEACHEALRRGDVIVLFPEGKTHNRMRVEPLKTGLARIALDAAAADVDVQIVPIGLNYLVRHAFRSDVHVAFGQPIRAEGSVANLTATISTQLQELSVHIEAEDDERLIAQVTSLIVTVREREGEDSASSPAERTALARRVVDAYRWLQERDPERTYVLRDRMQSLIEERAELGLGGERPTLQHRFETAMAKQWTQSRVLFALAAPFALYGVVNHVVPYLLLRLALALSPPTFARGALFRLGIGIAIFAVAYVCQTTGITLLFGPLAGVIYAILLVPFGLFARRYLSQLRIHRLGLGRMFRMIRYRGRIARLKAERSALTEELAELRHEYLAQLEPAADVSS